MALVRRVLMMMPPTTHHHQNSWKALLENSREIYKRNFVKHEILRNFVVAFSILKQIEVKKLEKHILYSRSLFYKTCHHHHFTFTELIERTRK